jgi:hypothetical protein
LLFIFCYQWLQASAKIFLANWRGVDVDNISVAGMGIGAGAGWYGVEKYVELVDLRPSVTTIGPTSLRMLNGVPVWEDRSERTNRACVEEHPERTRVLFIGSSITFGVDLDPDEAFTSALQARLNAAHPTPGFCVLNFAQPAFFFDQKYAVASVEVPRYRPALIMWENWLDWLRYSQMGDTLYASTPFALRADGFAGIKGVPDRLNRYLFLNSRAYRTLALSLGERRVETEETDIVDFIEKRLVQVPELAASVGARLVMYTAPPLDRPFASVAASPPPWQTPEFDFARARHIPIYSLAQELADEDYTQLRMDPCCHFNARGHAALVPVMERIILEQLDEPPTRLTDSASRKR